VCSAVNGTTGDSMSLSDEERRKVAEAWMAASKTHGTIVINHVGSNSITTACELAAHAQAIGCHAIAAMPPFFFKAASTKHLAEWLKRVGEAAPLLPFYYYHFSVITGVAVDPLELVKACEEIGFAQFRGFKFTDFNTWSVASVRNAVAGTMSPAVPCW
jgi:N-acetylneuraminate lyase